MLLFALLTKTLIFETIHGVLDTTLSVVLSWYSDFFTQYSDRHDIIEIFTNVVLIIITLSLNETTVTCLKQWLWIIERHFQLYKKFVFSVILVGKNWNVANYSGIKQVKNVSLWTWSLYCPWRIVFFLMHCIVVVFLS